MFMIKIVVMCSLVKCVLLSNKPFHCAGAYAAICFLLGLAFGIPFLGALIGALLVAGVFSIYFWLLYRFNGNGAIWWAIAIVMGVPLVLL